MPVLMLHSPWWEKTLSFYFQLCLIDKTSFARRGQVCAAAHNPAGQHMDIEERYRHQCVKIPPVPKSPQQPPFMLCPQWRPVMSDRISQCCCIWMSRLSCVSLLQIKCRRWVRRPLSRGDLSDFNTGSWINRQLLPYTLAPMELERAHSRLSFLGLFVQVFGS